MSDGLAPVSRRTWTKGVLLRESFPIDHIWLKFPGFFGWNVKVKPLHCCVLPFCLFFVYRICFCGFHSRMCIFLNEFYTMILGEMVQFDGMLFNC